MKIKYSYLVAVPANSATAKADLMTKLAAEMEHLRPPFSILAMPEGEQKDVIKTAELLEEALKAIPIPVSKEIRSFRLPPGEIDFERTSKVLNAAFNPAPKTQTLVIVIRSKYAEFIPGVFIWDFLGNHRILRNVTNKYRPGEAGIVTCRDGTRNCLRPEGYETWARQF